MTKHEWIETAKAEMELLCNFIGNWHPASKTRKPEPMTITAPDAEILRRQIEDKIAKRDQTDPVVRFRGAIKLGCIGDAIAILSDAWCGVPESTSCWRIPGFARAVDLMDDLPEDDE